MASMIASPVVLALGLLRKRTRDCEKVVNGAAPSHHPSPCPKDADIAYGVATSRGGRVYMEDYHSVVTSGSLENKLKGHSFFIVADGHGGKNVAEFLTQNLYGCLTNDLPKRGVALDSTDQLAQAMSEAILTVDDQLDALSSHECGSTALAALVSDSSLILANSGDSRAVLSRGGIAIALTNDHSPDRKDEQLRIEAAGGILMNNNGLRVMGVLAMTRALGDKILRKYGVIPNPDVCSMPIDGNDEFLILASDGLWSSVSNQDAVNIARQSIARAESRGASKDMASRVAARVLMRTAMHLGSRDNITIIVVDLNQLTERPERKEEEGEQSAESSKLESDSKPEELMPGNMSVQEPSLSPVVPLTADDITATICPSLANLKRMCHAHLPTGVNGGAANGSWPWLSSAEELMVAINPCGC